MASHLVYVDDSGTKEYAPSPQRYSLHGRGASRYFVFGAVLLPASEAAVLSERLQALKASVFDTSNVEIKSNWLRQPQESQSRYLRPYGLKPQDLKRFVDAYYEIVCAADLQFIAAVVDKLHMQQDYPTPWYPPDVAYEGVLQRVQRELDGRGTATITIDNMTGATPHQNQYRRNLELLHERLRRHGSNLQHGITFGAIEGRLRFVNSAQFDLVQVADIAAYNVYRQFCDHGEWWETEGQGTLPTYEHFNRIGRKFRCDESGRIQGFGIVKFPLRKRINWSYGPPEGQKKVAP